MSDRIPIDLFQKAIQAGIITHARACELVDLWPQMSHWHRVTLEEQLSTSVHPAVMMLSRAVPPPSGFAASKLSTYSFTTTTNGCTDLSDSLRDLRRKHEKEEDAKTKDDPICDEDWIIVDSLN